MKYESIAPGQAVLWVPTWPFERWVEVDHEMASATMVVAYHFPFTFEGGLSQLLAGEPIKHGETMASVELRAREKLVLLRNRMTLALSADSTGITTHLLFEHGL